MAKLIWTVLTVAAALAAPWAIDGASAQSYPTRPVTLIVPYPAGGPTDTMARVLAERMRTALGQTVIVENVSGAGGSIGTGRVARASPDGYTLSIGHVQTHVINAATQNLPYDVIKDFEPVTLIADTPQWLVVKKALPANNVKELIAWLKDNPGKATAGTVGAGGPTDIAGAYFMDKTGTKFQFVPYRGGAPLIQDLVAGQIDMTFGQAANYLGPVQGGQLRPLAVLAKKRWWAAPDVPTMDGVSTPEPHGKFTDTRSAFAGSPCFRATRVTSSASAAARVQPSRPAGVRDSVDQPSCPSSTPAENASDGMPAIQPSMAPPTVPLEQKKARPWLKPTLMPDTTSSGCSSNRA
jgi:tripartite-type tricarboxylate transporter receptor subunit TctC